MGTPTQVAHPWRSVVRTFVVFIVSAATAFLVRWIGIDLTTLGPAMVDSITAVVWTFLLGFYQWVITRPEVEGFLRSHGPVSWLATGVHTER